MILGIFLANGDSFNNMAKNGQDELFKKYYIEPFAENFTEIFIFSYKNERVYGIPKNVIVVSNKYYLNRYIYAILLPFIHRKIIKKCDIFRAYHLQGTIPAIITKIFFAKPFVFNYAYNYEKFAQIERKFFQLFLYVICKPIAIFFSNKILAANTSILANIPAKKAVYLPNGVDTNVFRPNKSLKKTKKIKILSVGRLVKQKNFESLIRAVQGFNIILEIVGNGTRSNQLLRLAKKCKVKLIIIKKVPHSKMNKTYRGSDIFVLSSIAEGSSKVLLEAMSSGLPCVVTNVESINDIVTNGFNGLITNPNEKEINKALNSLLKNRNYSKMLSKNARNSVLQNFNLDNLIKIEIETLKNANILSI